MKKVYIVFIAAVLIPSCFSVQCPVCQDESCSKPQMIQCSSNYEDPTYPTPPNTTPTQSSSSSATGSSSSSSTDSSSSSSTASSSSSSTESSSSSSTDSSSSSSTASSSSSSTESSSSSSTASSSSSSTDSSSSSSTVSSSSSSSVDPDNSQSDTDKSAKYIFGKNYRRVRRDTEDVTYKCVDVSYNTTAANDEESPHRQQYCVLGSEADSTCQKYVDDFGAENVKCTLTDAQPDSSGSSAIQVSLILVLVTYCVFGLV